MNLENFDAYQPIGKFIGALNKALTLNFVFLLNLYEDEDRMSFKSVDGTDLGNVMSSVIPEKLVQTYSHKLEHCKIFTT